MIDEKTLEYFIDKLGITEQGILVQELSGGFTNIPIQKKDILDFFSLDVSGTFVDFLNLKKELEIIKEIYSSPENILKSHRINYLASYYQEKYNYEMGLYSNLLSVDEYINQIYKFKNLEAIASKDKFRTILGGGFLTVAFMNYQSALELKQYRKGKNKSKSKYSKGIVYLLKIKGKQQFKIGVSKTFKKRYNKLSTLMPFELETVNTIKSNKAYVLENKLHNKFSDKKIKGEWFKLTQEDVDFICSIESDF